MTAMTLPSIPDPYKAARANLRVAAKVPVSGFPRLQEVLASGNGEITVSADFAMDENLPVFTGSLEGEVDVTCQRCLEVMSLALSAELSVAFVAGESQLASVPRVYDGVVFERQCGVDLAGIIEDEILLTLPAFPMHDPGACTASESMGAAGDAPEAAGKSPFDVLKYLK